MRLKRFVGIGLSTALVALVLVPRPVAAQSSTTAAIAGVAKDTTGAVLPGVTVEAASPALIEKVRTAVTDSSGNYKIIELRPGTYTVTFTLPGFSTYKRESVELTTGVTSVANAEMKVGGLEETVTVTGASPVVDIQNVRTQSVLKSETLDALPSGLKDLTALSSLTLGATNSTGTRNDVGGDRGELSTGISIHGSRGDDGRTNYDGMSTNVFYGGAGGQQRIYKFNTIGVQETVIDTGGNSAEIDTSGANVNMVPREGGNAFHGQGAASYTNGDLASDKVPQQLIDRGNTPTSLTMKKVYDYGVGIGGPIAKDRLWFYSANRWWGNESYAANNYFNKSTDWRRYEADLSRPAFSDQDMKDYGARLTWQAASKHKITFSENWQRACACWMGIGSTTAPESIVSYRYGGTGGMWLTQSSWSYPATNKVLLQAGFSYLKQAVSFTSFGGPNAAGATLVNDQGLGYTWGGLSLSTQNDLNDPQSQDNVNERVSMSYITGSHSFKVGSQTQQGVFNTRGNHPTGVTYRFNNGVPNQLTQGAVPIKSDTRVKAIGLFAQDQWTMKKLTLNLGLRFDHFVGTALAIQEPAGFFLPARNVPAVDGIPNLTDITPRIGVAFDVFGNGKTAIKGSWGRYVIGLGGGVLNQVSPANAVAFSVTRNWNDQTFAAGDPRRSNFVPDCDLKNLLANGECGQVSNLAFGQPVVNLTWDDSAKKGWGVREYNYQYTVTLQHELRPGFGVSVGYFRTDWRNQTQTVNILQGKNDFTKFSFVIPNDPRLGDRAGKTITNLYDVNANVRSSVQSVLMSVEHMNELYGSNGRKLDVFNSVDIGTNVRFHDSKALLSGGVSLGRQTTDSCYLNDFPNISSGSRTTEYCRVQAPLWSGEGSQVKLQAVYPLPLGIMASAAYKNLPGTVVTASYVATNAEVLSSLGRNLSSCAPTGPCPTGTTTIALIPDKTRFDERLNQIDIKLSRSVKVRTSKIQGAFEVYNLTNGRPSQANNNTFNATWLKPSVLLGGRVFKFGTQIDF